MLELITLATGLFSIIILSLNTLVIICSVLSKARPLNVHTTRWQDPPEVTILVPAYKEGAHVRYVLQSIKEVRYPKDKLRLIVIGEIDDPDTYREVAKHCSANGKLLNCGGVMGLYLVNSSGKKGKPAALNSVFSYVDSEITAIYDAEDTVHPDHVSVAIELLSDPSVAAVQFVREVARSRGMLTDTQIDDFYLYYRIILPYVMRKTGLAEICGSAFFIRTSYLKLVGGFNTDSPAEDLDLTYRIGIKGLRVLLALPPSITRPIACTASLVKQRARWIRGGIIAIPRGLKALPRSFPLLVLTGLAPLASITTTVAIVSGLATAVLAPVSPALVYLLYSGIALCLAGAVPIILGLGRGQLLRATKYITVMAAIYYLASWRALFELFLSPHSWTKSESKA